MKISCIRKWLLEKKGVTLVELLIVMAVIGVLASATIVLIDPDAQNQKARDARRKADIRQIQSALEMYRSDVGQYPLTAQFPAACGPSNFLQHGTTNYLAMPCDPRNLNSGLYVYASDATGSTYTMGACIEYDQDTDPIVSTNNHGLALGFCPTPQTYYVVTNP